MRTLLHRIAATFRRRRSDERLGEEVQAHLELLAADYERRGLPFHCRVQTVYY